MSGFFKLFSREKSIRDELVRLIKGNEFKVTQVELKTTQFELILSHSTRKNTPSHLELILIG